MNIPSPAAVKKLVEERKAKEAAAISESKSESSKKRPSGPSRSTAGSPSSRRNSSKSDTPQKTPAVGSPRSTRSTSKRTDSGTVSEGRKSTSTTPRRTSTTKSSEIEKKPFERPPHLTQRPLRNHPGLQAMLDSRPNDTRVRREIAKVNREVKQSKGQQVKKENN